MIDYNSLVNSNVKRIKPSGIRKFFDIANEMDDVISPFRRRAGFPYPLAYQGGGIHTLEKGRTRYTPNRGFLKLREEIPTI